MTENELDDILEYVRYEIGDGDIPWAKLIRLFLMEFQALIRYTVRHE